MKKPLYFLAGLMLALAGCRKDTPEASGCGPAETDGYRVFLHYRTQAPVPGAATGGQTYLVCEDSKINTTGSCALQTSRTLNGNLLRLSFCGVGPCGFTNDLGPARGSIDLTDLAPQKYQLEIVVRNRRTTGTLDLTVAPARLTIADSTVAAVR